MADTNRSEKAPRKRLTIQARLDILHSLSLGHTGSSLARKYGVTKAAISKIKISKENLLANEKARTGDPEYLKKNRIQRPSTLDDALISWFQQKKDRAEPVSVRMLKNKALQLNALLNGPTSFKASEGFVKSFKQRNRIRYLNPKKVKLPADTNDRILCSEGDQILYPENNVRDIDYGDDESDTDYSTPTAGEALRLCDRFLTWLQTRWEFGSDDLENMLSIREITARIASED